LVGGVVFLAYSAYLINEFFFADNSFQAVESRAKESPRNALLGIIFIGLPSLWFALFGRFTLRKENPKPVAEPSESDEDW
jgi:NADH:ubiquinone oxidoreductase subunit 5 (subunit L)/multisubunit Na+/H+ antiporter MnhA subunit